MKNSNDKTSLQLQGYCQVPERLKDKYNHNPVSDHYGCEERLSAIKKVLRESQLGEIADLGGNSGFFSLSLIDDGMAQKATVYDVDDGAMEIGEKMLNDLDLSEKIKFKKQSISLDFISSMPPVDTIICLNLIHHAGCFFDVHLVESIGWEEYAKRFLTALKDKCNILIIGAGFKLRKPIHWDVPRPYRALRFSQIAKSIGYEVLYNANVKDIEKFGIEAADNKLIEKSKINSYLSYLSNYPLYLYTFLKKKDIGVKQKYHIYILKCS